MSFLPSIRLPAASYLEPPHVSRWRPLRAPAAAISRADGRTIAAALEGLQLDLARELPERLRKLGELVDRAEREQTAESVAELRALAHRLRGTVGSFGFVEVSDAVGALEEALVPGEPLARGGALVRVRECLATAAAAATRAAVPPSAASRE